MELAIILVVAVLVLALAVVFFRSAAQAYKTKLAFRKFGRSPTASMQNHPQPPLLPQTQPMPFPAPSFQMSALQGHQMQQSWQRQQQPQHRSIMANLTIIPQQQAMVNFDSAQDTSMFFPELVQHRLNAVEVTMTRKLSTGSFGVVWLGHCQGQPVAIKKMLHAEAEAVAEAEDEEETQLFAKEILLMARLIHPRIVRFLGCTWTDRTDLAAVSEYMQGGDLTCLLENQRVELRWHHEKISIALDIAEALEYLHSLAPKLIHRDLKSRNVLLDATWRAKLSDFGLSRNRTFEQTLTAGVGTLQWTAPEVLLGHNYSEQADIYSFGVVLSELDTREMPFELVTGHAGAGHGVDMHVVIQIAKGELRPRFSTQVPSCIDQIAHACLQFDPALRPTASQLVVLLSEAKAELTM